MKKNIFLRNDVQLDDIVVCVNAFVRKRFVHLISLLALIAFLVPGGSNAMRAPRLLYGQIDASGISLFLMMLSAAVQCDLGAFRAVVARPKPLLTCLTQFFVVLPIGCWVLGQLCIPLLGRALGEPIQLGLELVILMPVAATASIWVRDTKGDIELLVCLITITMSVGTLTTPVYLYFMNGFAANSIEISPLLILRQLIIGVLLPLLTGIALHRLLRDRMAFLQPYFALLGTIGLFVAVFLNVGTAAPLLRHIPLNQIGYVTAIVLAVNLTNFAFGSLIGRLVGLSRSQQVTCEFSSGMRSNGTALVVGLASFPGVPLVTVPAAIYIIFQHLLAGAVRSRLSSNVSDHQHPSAADVP